MPSSSRRAGAHSAGIAYPSSAGLISAPVWLEGDSLVKHLRLAARDRRARTQRGRSPCKRVLQTIEHFPQQLDRRFPTAARSEWCAPWSTCPRPGRRAGTALRRTDSRSRRGNSRPMSSPLPRTPLRTLGYFICRAPNSLQQELPLRCSLARQVLLEGDRRWPQCPQHRRSGYHRRWSSAGSDSESALPRSAGVEMNADSGMTPPPMDLPRHMMSGTTFQ